jgi:hypothetical protein
MKASRFTIRGTFCLLASNTVSIILSTFIYDVNWQAIGLGYSSCKFEWLLKKQLAQLSH